MTVQNVLLMGARPFCSATLHKRSPVVALNLDASKMNPRFLHH